MRTEIFTAAIIVATTIVAVRYVDRDRSGAGGVRAPELAAARSSQTSSSTAQPARASWGQEVRITSSRDHQFYINVNVNRRSAHFLIDTGASFVALRDSDAREAGVYTSWTDYTYPVRTANGETKAALVTIDEMQIDGIRVEGVKAFILPDDQLSINLLGMSFLSRIESVEARSGEMVLKG
jgi:aspartyl protease family protein